MSYSKQIGELTGRLAQLTSERGSAARNYEEVSARASAFFTTASHDRLVIIDHEIENVALAIVHLARAAKGQL